MLLLIHSYHCTEASLKCFVMRCAITILGAARACLLIVVHVAINMQALHDSHVRTSSTDSLWMLGVYRRCIVCPQINHLTTHETCSLRVFQLIRTASLESFHMFLNCSSQRISFLCNEKIMLLCSYSCKDLILHLIIIY